MTFDWDHWDKVASVVTGLITVAGLAWAFFKRLRPRTPVEGSDRERWYKHLDAVAERARIEPSEGLEAGVTNAILAKTYVQLAVKPNEPGKAEPAPVPRSTQEAMSGDIWELLRSRPEKVLFVLGRPGVGKTTLIHHMAAELTGLGRRGVTRWIRARRRDRPNAGPFWIRLRDFTERPDIVAALDSELWQPPSPYVVLVDGLDEIPDAHRHNVARWIGRRAAQGGARWVVTSRPEGFEKLDVPCCHLEVQPLDMPRIGALVRAHFQGEPQKAESLLDQIRRRETYYQFARNPLLLRMMVDLHRSGESAETRVELYRKILLAVLDRRQHDKGVLGYPGRGTPRGAGEGGVGDGRSPGGSRGGVTSPDRTSHASAGGGMGAGRVSFLPRRHAAARVRASQFPRVSGRHRCFGTRRGALFRRHKEAAADGSFWNEAIRFYALLSPARFHLVFGLCKENHADILIACGLEIPAGKEWDEARSTFNAWLDARLNDPDGWREAAEAQLQVRLRSMEPRGDDAVADTSLVTNAELQLFLETEKGGKHVPLHWERDHFPAGAGSSPALGVSSACARDFCAWVSARDPVAVYHLPVGSDDHAPLPEFGSYWSELETGTLCDPKPPKEAIAKAELGRLAEAFAPNVSSTWHISNDPHIYFGAKNLALGVFNNLGGIGNLRVFLDLGADLNATPDGLDSISALSRARLLETSLAVDVA